MDTAEKAFSVSVTLLAGYLFVRLSPYRRFQAENLRSDRYAFHVLAISLMFYAGGVATTLLAGLEDGPLSDLTKKIADYVHIQVPVIIAIGLALLWAAVDSLLTAFLMRNDPSQVLAEWEWKRPFAKIRLAAVARAIRKSDDSVLRLLWRAMVNGTPLMVTLKSGKVYVGKSAETISDPSIRSLSLKIIPFFSGYRTDKTHKVELPTDYERIYALMQRKPDEDKERPVNLSDPLAVETVDLKRKDGTLVEVDMQDMGVVILWSEVQSLTLYDKSIYRAFQEAGPPKKKEEATLFGKDGLIAKILARYLVE